MTDISSFCTGLNLDEAAVRRILDAEHSPAVRPAPWYVLLLLGVGAWITALIMIVFVAVFLDFVFGFDEPDIGSAAIGVVMFLAGLFIQAKTTESIFAEQFAIALVAAGAAIAAGSIGFEFDSVWSAAVAAAAMTALDIWRGRKPQQQFLLAALAVGLGVATVADTMDTGRANVVALALPIGALLYLWPFAKDARPTATALLVAMPFYAIVNDSLYDPTYGSENWPARLIAMAVILVLAWLHARGPSAAKMGAHALFIAAIATAVCLLLPPGGSAALVILMLAFTLGHWPLAIIGALLQVYFVPRFFYDLELSLLTKSWILMAVGVALLAAYAVLSRRGPESP